MALIAPSILAADFARLGEAIREVESWGASIIHIDVSDGHFCPEISVGQPVVRSVRQATGLELEIHLEIEHPERYLTDFIRAGADRIALHPESTPDIYKAAMQAKEQGVKVGLALYPGAYLETTGPLFKKLDYLLVLSSTAADQEREFIPETVGKVRALSREREKQGLHLAIEVEGGIGPAQAEELALAGADILVTGSAIFNSNDHGVAFKELQSRAKPDLFNQQPGDKADDEVR